MTLHDWVAIGVVAGALVAVGTILRAGVRMVLVIDDALEAVKEATAASRTNTRITARRFRAVEARLDVLEAHQVPPSLTVRPG